MMQQPNFTDLRCRYQTGRSYVISGEGRNRVYGYRTGVQCDLGDIERSEWCELVRDLIHKTGEQQLYEHLLEWLKGHNCAKESKKDLEFHALELHADRIFDDERWVGFLEFNSRYRPVRLASVRLIWIQNVCCRKPGQITQALLESQTDPHRICCPHCGRWSEYEILNDKE